MSKLIGSKEEVHLRQEIISQCTWSETYSSLKHILKRTANQLPLLISFINNNSDQQVTNNNYRTILFFHRTFSNKLLLTPLQRRKDQPDQFEIYPHHCTFVMPDFFRGLFEFVLCGQRCSRIYRNLEQLITFASDFKHSIVFMSRDRVVAYFQDSNFLYWSSKKYPQGSIFRAERIHRSSVSSRDGHQVPNDYLECLDEDGYYVFIKMKQSGRYSIIATSIEQQENQPEIYLHSTQTSNIDQLIKRVTLYYDNKSNNNNNIRLVRGSVPHNFLCQHFHFIRQHTYEMLVGLTQEGLVIEWNLECHVPCRYATNLNDILDSTYGTVLQQTLESYINQAQKHYRNNFQYNIQLASSQDWTGFFQYWIWTRKNRQKSKDDNKVTSQRRRQFHLVASIQDLSDNSQGLSSTSKNNLNVSLSSSSLKENSSTQNKKVLLPKQHSFFSQMSKLILSSASSRHHHSDRLSRQTRRTSGFMLPNTTKPFDDSIYESNQVHSSS
ncbi:unnamed protein product [Rotaria sordida]|uniref:Uncharacterized protein n=1 Tax=Rotaria sordida TaxID=392033 RepID=A0A818RGY2_9BILA|nr:unnamed protein product [Rotaria sordida]CAF1262388.1 unnamed protein product [Rotaria sordida]CAF3650945.1 unnamed protein product [Rotaria sordida]CAF3999129.1 unnamed protein product [Rotaria sordida]